MNEGEKEALKIKANYLNTIGAGLAIAGMVTTPIALRSMDVPHEVLYVAYAIVGSLAALALSLMLHQRALHHVRKIGSAAPGERGLAAAREK